MTKKVSLADVARSLGISKTVVSLVINGKADQHGISKQTQQRVMERIQKMNYRPDELARGFRTGRTMTLGMIVSDISNEFYSQMARKVEDLAWQNGYSMVICSNDEEIEKEMKQIDLLLDRHVDGLIVSTAQTDSRFFDELRVSGIPHVLIDRIIPGAESATVSVDNGEGSRMVARHLVEQGCTEFLLFANSPVNMSTMDQRIAGFREEIGRHGVALAPEDVTVAPIGHVKESIRDCLDTRMKGGRMPHAIFALNGIIAFEVIKYLETNSISVPDKISVVAFDDSSLFNLAKPSVTAVRQPIDRIGEEAFKLLIGQINGESQTENQSVVLPVEMVIRESTLRRLG